MRTNLALLVLMCSAIRVHGLSELPYQAADEPVQIDAEKAPTGEAKASDNPTSNQMANFERLIGGEWKRTFANGTSMVETWHWGPGKHSIRAMTEGESASRQPWQELRVFYWHPAHKHVAVLGMSPYARGITHGTIEFSGDAAKGRGELRQQHENPSRTVVRSMGLRWKFDGPDKYHDVLLEDGGKGFEVLVEWDQFRSRVSGTQPSRKPIEKFSIDLPRPSERLTPLLSLIGQTWESKEFAIDGKHAKTEPLKVKTTFEWVPYADVVYMRAAEIDKTGDTALVLDGYIYHNTGHNTPAGILRCLILTRDGGVYEGDVVLEGETLQVQLEGHAGDQLVPLHAQLRLEKDGTLRQSVWLQNGHQSVRPLFEVEHAKVPSKSP